MNRDNNKVLACVDQSHFADYVADYAIWASGRLAAPLEFLHALDRHPERASSEDHSGAIGLGAQEQLLLKLSSEDEARMKAAREQGRIFLNRLCQQAVSQGIAEVDMRQRHGSLVDTLIDQQHDIRLLVLGRRGRAAEKTQRELGQHVEQVIRSLNRPILTVTAAFTPPQRILIAFNGSAVTRRCIEMVAKSPLFKGVSVYLLMCHQRTSDALKQLAWAEKKLQGSGLAVEAVLQVGDTEQLISAALQTQNIDLLVMGAYGHSPLRNFFFGSKTTDLLRAVTIPTLLLR